MSERINFQSWWNDGRRATARRSATTHPEPLPLKEQEAVYRRLEAIENAQQRVEDARLRRQMPAESAK